MPVLDHLKERRPTLSGEILIALVSAFFVLLLNGPLWSAVRAAGGSTQVVLSLGGLLFAMHALLFGLLCWGRLLKPVLALLLLTTAVAHWYMTRYAVMLDTGMIRNLLQTDLAESRELLSWRMLLHVALLGVLPMLLLSLVVVRQRCWRAALAVRAGFLLLMALMAAAAVLPSSQGLFSLVRANPALRYKITPANYLVGLVRAVRESGDGARGRTPLGTDAAQSDGARHRRPRVVVLVVGETVRGDHWGLNGYARQTTPALAARGVINFPDVTACGTSTEVSLPCMFSAEGRAGFDHGRVRRQQSVLDVVARAGIHVLWRDNQSGCKGTCVDVLSETLGPVDGPALCSKGRCFDEILLSNLEQRIAAGDGDVLLVLHMLGNHGPTYFERYPPQYRHWLPECTSTELARCDRQAIVNAYDNAILYADAVLGQLIDRLAALPDRDAAMLYLSDHGESLGEYGMYLHGAPEAIAPREQLHVPMTLWMSEGFVRSDRLDVACLVAAAAKPASHDNLFSTLLGAFGVQTQVYRRERDLLAACRAH